MNFEEKLKYKFRHYYDITDSKKVGNILFDFVAIFNQRSAAYILQKSNEYYAFENNEYFLYKKLDGKLNKDFLVELKKFFEKDSKSIIPVHDEHMSSDITVILEAKIPEDEEIKNAIKNFKYYKSFMFGFKGWVNGGLVLIDPDENQGISNKYSKKTMNNLLS